MPNIVEGITKPNDIPMHLGISIRMYTDICLQKMIPIGRLSHQRLNVSIVVTLVEIYDHNKLKHTLFYHMTIAYLPYHEKTGVFTFC